MASWLGKEVEVLVEEKHKDRWRGRSPQGKLVFFDDERDLRGYLVKVQITYTGPWSMSGQLVADSKLKVSDNRIELAMLSPSS